MDFKLSDKVYKVLKWISITAVDAFVTFFGIVLPLYGVSAEVVNIVTVTLAAIGTLIGALIGVSTKTYNKYNKRGNTEDEEDL